MTTNVDLTHSDVQTSDNKLHTFLLLLLSDILYALLRNFQKQMFYYSDCMGNVVPCEMCTFYLRKRFWTKLIISLSSICCSVVEGVLTVVSFSTVSGYILLLNILSIVGQQAPHLVHIALSDLIFLTVSFCLFFFFFYHLY